MVRKIFDVELRKKFNTRHSGVEKIQNPSD